MWPTSITNNWQHLYSLNDSIIFTEIKHFSTKKLLETLSFHRNLALVMYRLFKEEISVYQTHHWVISLIVIFYTSSGILNHSESCCTENPFWFPDVSPETSSKHSSREYGLFKQSSLDWFAININILTSRLYLMLPL